MATKYKGIIRTRPISFEQAKARYVHRFTMEHVPEWARRPSVNGLYYKPQFRDDREWYCNTLFFGEHEDATRNSCYSRPTWPLGSGFASEPFRKA